MHHIWARLVGAVVFAVWSASLAAVTIGGIPGGTVVSAAAPPVTPTSALVADARSEVPPSAAMPDRPRRVTAAAIAGLDRDPDVVEPSEVASVAPLFATPATPPVLAGPPPVLAGPPPVPAPLEVAAPAPAAQDAPTPSTPAPTPITPRPTATASPTPVSTPTATATPTPVPSPTPTPAPSPTPTPTPTPSPTPRPLLALVPPVLLTPVPAPVPVLTAPAFVTPVPISAPTPAPPVAGPPPTAVPTPEVTAVPTPEVTAVPTPQPTPRPTPAPTPAPTPVPTPVPTPAPTPEPTPNPTAVPSPTATPVPSGESPSTGGTNAGVRAQSIPAGAVSIRTDQNAAAIARQHPAGTTFVFESGLHRGVSIRPQNGDSFLGRPGAVLSGAGVLNGFSARDGFWAVGGQTSELFGSGGCEYLADGTRYRACSHPEQLFVDGETWRQVSSLKELGDGRWYFDYDRDRVYVGASPAGRTIEFTTTPNAFVGTARDVRIAGLVIERYANRAQTGAIEAAGSSGWVIEANELRLNHGFGLRIGHRMQVRDNYVHHNGQIGVGGIGHDVVVTGNEIAYNHTAGYLEEWEAGGTKFVFTKNLVFRHNWVHHNSGRGVWTDIDNVDSLIANNLVEWNTRGGIVHEISYDAVIRDNVARYNGLGFPGWVWGAQILIQNSSDTQVFGNEVTVSANGGNGITVVNQSRGKGPRGLYRSDRVTVTDNVIRHLGTRGRNGAPNGCNQTNTFDRNVYEAPAQWFAQTQFEWCGLVNWKQFRQSGQEPDGERVTRS